jgi:hypothetical protein
MEHMKIVIAVLVVIIAVLVIVVISLLASQGRSTFRREEWKRAREARHLAEQNLTSLEFTVDKIESALDVYSDIESPLAAKVRQVIREYRNGKVTPTE